MRLTALVRQPGRTWAGRALGAALLTAAATGCSSDPRDPDELTVTIVSPSEGDTITGAITVAVDVEPQRSGVTVFLGNTARLERQTGARYTFEWTPPYGAGEARIIARATDEATGELASDEVRVSYVPDYLPRLTVCETLCREAPESLDVVGVVTLAVEVDRHLREDEATVVWTVDGAPIPSEAAYPFRAEIDTTALADGDRAVAFTFAPAIGTGGSGTITLRVANCDGDGDGYPRPACGGDDCDDGDPDVHPGAAETCDGASDDCDAEIDEDATCPDADDVCLVGACRPAFCREQGQACVDDSQSIWPWVCDLGTETCRQRCALDHPIPERACPAAHSCRPAPGFDGGEGLCVLPECTGEPDGSCDGDAVCIPYDFGFGECGTDGTGEAGAGCTVATRLDAVLVDGCSTGTECFAGECRTTCDPTVSECGAGFACVRVWDSVREVAEGTCLRPCDAFGSAGCLEGSACQPVADFAFTQSTSWACLPAPGGAVAEGEPCLRGVDVCEGGTHCIDVAGPAGTDPRCTRACDLADPERDCGEGHFCTPTFGGVRGTCVEYCAPFPRRGTGGYECASDTATCHRLPGPGGACVEDVSTVEAGEACTVPRTFGECPDDGYCVDLAVGGDSPSCHTLCDPFSDAPVCGLGEVCNARPLLDGQGAIGVCDPAPNAGDVGDPCTSPGHACAAHGTLCIDTGAGPTCRRTCAGPVDCDEARCLWTAPLDGLVVRGQAGVCEL